ncbi:MAG: chemotaxis protein CheW [Gemmatimonadaceae bacterium]
MDWTDVRQRVDAAGRALTGTAALSPARVREVLDARARALARPVAMPASGGTLELVTFALANEVYAVESRFVAAVFRLVELSPLPGAAQPVCGVTAWRGELLVVLDLRASLGLSVAALNDLSRVIVLGEERAAFGVLADAVREIVTLPIAAVRAPPEGVAVQREYLRGITDDAVLVLDAGHLLRAHA